MSQWMICLLHSSCRYTSPRAPPERKLDKEPLCIKKTPVVSVHSHNSNAASVLDSYGEFGPSHSLLL